MIRRPPRSTQSRSSAASDVYKRQRSRCLCALSPPCPEKRRVAGVQLRYYGALLADCILPCRFGGARTHRHRMQGGCLEEALEQLAILAGAEDVHDITEKFKVTQTRAHLLLRAERRTHMQSPEPRVVLLASNSWRQRRVFGVFIASRFRRFIASEAGRVRRACE